MSYQFNTSRAYLAFDFVVQNIESWLDNKTRPILKYSSSAISSRIAQRFVELGLVPFIHDRAVKYEAEWNHSSILSESLDLSGIHVSKVNEQLIVKLDKRATARAIVDFSVHWFHVLAVVLSSCFRPSSKVAKPSTLVFGLGPESITKDGDDAALLIFCKTGPIAPLNEAKSLIIQTALVLESTQEEYASYSRFPLMKLLEKNPPRFRQVISFIYAHISAAIAYFRLVYRCSLASLIGRDFAYHAMVDYLNQSCLIESLVITNSNYSSQPLWMRQFNGRAFTTHMVWYSQNTIPFVYKHDPVSSPLPNNRHICVDDSWVWNEAYAAYLTAIGIKARMHVVGPIVWYVPEPFEAKPKSLGVYSISIFDVTPVIDSFAKKIGLMNNYYTANHCVQFVQDIVTAVKAIEIEKHIKVELILKHKRGYNDLHDKTYIDYVQSLNASQALTLVDYEADIFDLIASSSAIIVIPYSSPVVIANSLNIPSIYFDPTQEILPTCEMNEHMYFASGIDELKNKILEIIQP